MTRMLRDYEELAITRKQLALAEDALVSLHERVYARNPRNYAVFAEGPIDMILELRAQIDAFLHIAPGPSETQVPGRNGTAGTESAASAEVVAAAGVSQSSS